MKNEEDIKKVIPQFNKDINNCEESIKNYIKEKEELSLLDLVLILLNYKVIDTAREVSILVEKGYGSGALARWRTIHESRVMAIFIKTRGDQAEECAEAYIAHYGIQGYNKFILHSECAEEWGFSSLDYLANKNNKKKLDEAGYELTKKGLEKYWEDKKNQLVSNYGKAFVSDYGWADKFRDKSFKDESGFKGIQIEIGYGYYNAFYSLACEPNHSSIQSTRLREEIIRKANGEDERNNYNDMEDSLCRSSEALIDTLKLLIDLPKSTLEHQNKFLPPNHRNSI